MAKSHQQTQPNKGQQPVIVSTSASPDARKATGDAIDHKAHPPGPDWAIIQESITIRHELIEKSIREVKKLGVEEPDVLCLAAMDVFVEKAQDFLTKRGDKLMRNGWYATYGALAILSLASVFIAVISLDSLQPTGDITGPSLTMRIIRAVSFSAFTLGAVYMLASLARAFFHEGTVLLNRREAIRFGRLFVYSARGKVNLPDIETAFQWNSEYSTAFKDIRPELLSGTLWQQIAEKLPESLKRIADIIDAYKGTPRIDRADKPKATSPEKKKEGEEGIDRSVR